MWSWHGGVENCGAQVIIGRSQKFQNLIISYIQVLHFLGLIGKLISTDQVTRCFTLTPKNGKSMSGKNHDNMHQKQKVCKG